jgi:hypothetical protein
MISLSKYIIGVVPFDDEYVLKIYKQVIDLAGSKNKVSSSDERYQDLPDNTFHFIPDNGNPDCAFVIEGNRC